MDSNSPKKKSYLSVRILIFIALSVVISGIYYFIEYERYFVSDETNDKFLTVWKRPGGQCYITPGIYRSVFVPKENFLKTDNHARLFIIWNPSNDRDEIAIYPESIKSETKNIDSSFIVYSSRYTFFKRFTHMDYDSSKKTIFDKDSIEYEENIYNLDYIELHRLGTMNKIIKAIDNIQNLKYFN